MEFSVLVITFLIGFLSIYVFYLVSIYVKLENRRSLILSKFTEIDKQIENKLEEVKKLCELLDDKELCDARVNLLNSVCINDKIKHNKILDSLVNDINSKSKKVLNILNSVNNINDKINYAKEFYNESLYEYNIILSSFNGMIMKKIFKYCEYNTF